ncbi:MAG TPA: hypothetical protein VG106_00320 [Vicinamibacterales bacterium]|nr:hypothetical protein [Vicinamibacterales bacterium]
MLWKSIAAVAALAALSLVGGGASKAALTANTQTFEDSRAEIPNAPDISNVVVANNDAGRISFTINGIGGQLTEGMLVGIDIDADNNAATGSTSEFSQGADYAIELFRGTANLFRWDGTNFTRRANDPPQSTLVFNNLTLSINAAELGNTRRFKFGVIVITGITNDVNGDPDFTNAMFDSAPDVGHGFWEYNVRIAPLRLLARSFSISPRRPRAGGALTARMVAARSDTGAVLTGGRVVCTARVAGRRISGRGRFVGTQARCVWRVPAGASGQRISGSIAVVFEGRRVTRSFSAPIG